MKRTFYTSRLPIFLFSTVVWLGFTLMMASRVQTEEKPPPGQKAEEWLAEHIPGSKKERDLRARGWQYGSYVDVGYTVDFNDPENGLWRSKGTTFKVDDPQVNMAMAYLAKDAMPQSRWGMQFGLQTGVDTKKLVPEPTPPSNVPISNADLYRHFARANASYLFPVRNGFRLTGGLINSYIAYESYYAMGNPNYTRGYITDNVPYFLFGVEGLYPLKDTLNLSLYAVNGWNYLANPNDHPSFGLQVKWEASPRIVFTQNLYYGPEQENTDLQFWRFFSDSILQWKKDPFLVAISFDVGTEKQAEPIGNPRHHWMAGALWAAWHMGGPWTLAFRPEFYYDPDGLITGAQQTIQAYTVTLKYEFSPIGSHKVVAAIEYRYDRSTGPEGGFFKGPDNILVPDQHVLIFALNWHFGRK
ncbi:MAG: outer membrane beta-barrel protein [Desulfobacteraceae bacterium]